MSIEKICKKDVVTVSRDETIARVAELMRDRSIGDVVVVENKDGALMPLGIVTDRDIVTCCLAGNAAAINETRVQDVMSENLLTVQQSDDIYDCLVKMQDEGVGRCPVVDEQGCLVGIVTSTHLLEFINKELSALTGISRRHRESAGATGMRQRPTQDISPGLMQ